MGPHAAVLLVVLIVGGIVIDVRSRLAENRSQEETVEGNSDEAPGVVSTIASDDTPADTCEVATISCTHSQQSWADLDDPTSDGWETEAFNNAAGDQFKALGKLLGHPEEITDTDLSELAAQSFACGPLVPENLELAFEDRTWQVERLPAEAEHQATDTRGVTGPAGLREALAALAEPFAGAEDLHTKFKIFRVEVEGRIVVTQQYVEISGRFPDGVLEQHATWGARWESRSDGPPRLLSLEVLDFEQVRNHTPEGPLYADCTESVLERNDCYAEQLLRGYNHWLWRIQNTRYFFLLGTPGIAMGDVNGDGLNDLYVCQEQGLPNLLFLQRPDGTVAEVGAAWGVDWLVDGRAPLLVDFDNDGDQDLAVSFLGGVILASNENNTGFRLRTVLDTTEDVMSLAAADFDDDGDLDLYVTAYYADQVAEKSQGGSIPASAGQFVYHNATNGGRNSLWQNNADGVAWAFRDVTDEVGLEKDDSRFSFAATWDDYDNDGDLDLYVANDYGKDNLYRNEGGVFEDISDAAHVENAASGMSAAWGDYDRDGWMDVYLGNMWSSAGNRIAFQPQFKTDAPTVRDRLQRFARGNTLLRNRGDGSFDDTSAPAGVEMGRWSWCSQFADINNDGWEDILVANGYITGDDSGDL